MVEAAIEDCHSSTWLERTATGTTGRCPPGHTRKYPQNYSRLEGHFQRAIPQAPAEVIPGKHTSSD